ncbi:hypothetical protein HW555_009267 [Spodoptera exigua]|uniref:Uncharacterized protein n=1 Tax=Spodoptera exigua TaxID=7107 RepID=A0A835GDE3_SPOEX|nr:hypothetical protein HW555_009267 [Spodoptera exigua]
MIDQHVTKLQSFVTLLRPRGMQITTRCIMEQQDKASVEGAMVHQVSPPKPRVKMLRRGQLLVNKALDINNDDTNEAITAQGSEEPSTSQALEKLSSPLSNNLTSPDRLEEYSSPILDLLANLSPFKSPDYVSDSSDYGDDIIVAGGKKMRLPNGKSRCTIIEESASEGENTAKSPAFIPCSDDDTVSINYEVPTKGRPKKGRQFKYGGLSRMERKRNRHSNKAFHNYKNIEVQPKNMYIAASVKEADVKRRMTNSNMKKKFSRKYLLDKVEVCRDLFVKTLGVSTKRVNTALTKMRSQDCLDKRGSKSGGKNKCSDELVSQVRCHINSLPKYKSHYRRSERETEYLMPDMTLDKMYDLYCEHVGEAEKVSKAMYTKLFYTYFNLKRAPLKKDTCNKCDTLQAKLTHCKTAEEKIAIDTEREEHCRKWEQARHKMKADFVLATQCKEIECLTFDLQKTLPMPKIPTGIIYYKRQLWLYNMGIYSAKTNSSGCFVWIEGMAGKECINWLQTREIYIERDSPNSIYFKTDFYGNAVEVNIGRAPVRGRPALILMEHLVPLWPSGKPVSPAKLADIQSILHLIPQDAQSFYNGLDCDNTIEDDIDGLDTVDFEIQFDDNQMTAKVLFGGVPTINDLTKRQEKTEREALNM